MKRRNTIKYCPNDFILLLYCMAVPTCKQQTATSCNAIAGNKNQYMQYPQTVAIELESMVNSDYIGSVAVVFFFFSPSFSSMDFSFIINCSVHTCWTFLVHIILDFPRRGGFSLKLNNEWKGRKV